MSLYANDRAFFISVSMRRRRKEIWECIEKREKKNEEERKKTHSRKNPKKKT